MVIGFLGRRVAIESRRAAAGVLVLAVFAGACRQSSRPDSGAVASSAKVEQRQSTLTALSRTGWTASASTGASASNAIDGSATTRWTTTSNQVANQWFQLDMAVQRTFTELRLDTTTTATDFPRAYAVTTSDNGTTWSSAIATGAGAGAVVTIPFASQTARFVRVTLTAGAAAPWSIYELNVYDTVQSRTGWVATASVNSANAPLAVDATVATRWNTGTTQSTGQFLQVDMTSPQTFSQITLDTGNITPVPFPRGYSVTTSNDGTNWSAAIATGTGANRLTVINFATQQARFVRITLTMTNSTPWSVEELNVNGQPTGPITYPRIGWVATGSANTSGNIPANAIDGSATTRWTTSTAQASGQFFQVDMGTFRTFTQVALDAGTTTNNFPRSWQLQTSNNGTTWTTITSGTGSTALVTITVPAQTARFIKVNLTAANTNPWSIQELNVSGPALTQPGWVATGSANSTGNVPANAIDGSATTRWSTTGAQTNTFFTVDLGTAQVFNQLTLDAGTTPNNFPRNYSVFVSNDGTNWGTAVATGTGTGQLVTINFLTKTARFFKIQTPTTPVDTNTWSIQELNVARIAQPCDSITCTASDQCHVAGVCDPSSGVCSNPNATNGTTCNDANACTTGETCQSGVCTNGAAVTCTADQCHNAGTCVPATGCPAPTNKTNGTTCNDANACTTGETCQSGLCTNGAAVTCTADQCHNAGTCVPATGCPAPTNKTNGTTCNDANACTQTDTCQSGVCTGANPVVCTASDQCHNVGTCNTGTGVCSNPAKNNGTTCNDANACTTGEACQNGTCGGGTAVTCTADQCHNAGTCVPATGCPAPTNKTNGTTCNDSNACTTGEACQAGVCSGGTAVTCTADQCHDAGTCVPATGCPTGPNKPNGTTCNDNNACTQTDTCQSGACFGGNPIACAASDQCHSGVSTCNPATGFCSGNALATEGTACDDGNRCSVGDACHKGTCLPGTTNSCTGVGAAKYASVIDLGSAQGWSYAAAINNSGVVVGTDVTTIAGIYQLGFPGSKGFHWSESEGMVPLPWTGAASYANDINDSGVMSVTAGVNPWEMLPCRFDPAVDAHPVCQTVSGHGAGINATGTMTGAGYLPELRMFRINAGPVEVLPSITKPNPQDMWASGAAIAADGSVVGVQYVNSSWTPIRYTASRGTELLNDLVPPGNDWNLASASMIRPGEIVGWGYHGGHGRAYRLKTNATGDVTEIVPLPMPHTFAPDAANVMAAGESNASGEIVGSVFDAIPFWPQTAFVYRDGIGSMDLNTLIDPQSGWNLVAGSAINDNHEVVGYGTHNGVNRAFKLTLPDLSPCPPSTDTCHQASGVRDPLTGVCSYAAKPDGTSCNDGLACTQSERCQAGSCQALVNPPPVILNLPIEYLGSFGPQSFPYDINSSGTSVGWASTPDLQNYAWKANGPGTITNLGTQLGLGSPSSAQAINDSNTIVGFETSAGVSKVFRYGAGGFKDDFDDLSDGTPALNEESYVLHAGIYVTGSFPTEINNAGDFVGFYTAGNKYRGFRVRDGMPPEDVPPLVPGGSTVLYGISETGTVVGNGSTTTTDFGPTHAVLYDNEIVGLVDLNTVVPGSGWELWTATSINGDYVVGAGVHNGDGVYRPYRLHLSSHVVDDISGGWYSSGAAKVNAAGDTVGAGAVTFEEAQTSHWAAFVFTDQLGFKNILDIIPQDFSWYLANPASINDSGDIVGWGYYGGGWGPGPWHVKLPAGQAATCKARSSCGGDVGGDQICLFSDGVVETSPGHFVAVFGYDNASVSSLQPTINQVSVDPATIPPPVPPASLAPGTHTGAFLPRFEAGQTIAWTVNGETVTASASSPRLQTVDLPNGRLGVEIGGQTLELPITGVAPRLEGVVNLGGTGYMAVFGYDNETGDNVNFPYGTADNIVSRNGVEDLQPSPRPPVWFQPGSHLGTFLPTFAPSGEVVWNLGGTPVRASAASPPLQREQIGLEGLGVRINGKLITLVPDARTDLAGGVVSSAPPGGGTTTGGSIPGSFNVTDDGSATYRISLWTPDGRAGLQPDLALAYSSGSGADSAVGFGWRLEGLSTIMRCHPSFGRDGETRPIRFTSEDKLCLDGERLVVVSGTYGQTGAEYRTEYDHFKKIVQTGSDSLGPTGFLVYQPDGRRVSYGNDTTSALTGYRPEPTAVLQGNRAVVTASADNNDKSDPTVSYSGSPARLTWAVGVIGDRYGNEIRHKYAPISQTAQDPAIDFRVTEIHYGTPEGARGERIIAFDYDSVARQDVRDSYTAGLPLKLGHLLSAIIVRGPDPVDEGILRKYFLGYRNEVGKRALLTSVKECDDPGICKPPTTFQYTDVDPGFTRVPTGVHLPVPIYDLSNIVPGDVNGDGKDDLIVHQPDGIKWQYLPSTGTGVGAPILIPYPTFGRTESFILNSAEAEYVTWGGRTADLNADGRDDFIVPIIEALPTIQFDTMHHQILLSTPQGFFPFDTANNYESIDLPMWCVLSTQGERPASIYVADMNGDGLPDLMRASGTSWPGNISVVSAWAFRLNTSPIVPPDGYELFIHGAANEVVPTTEDWNAYATDFDGDGKSELLVRQSSPIGPWLPPKTRMMALKDPQVGGASSVVNTSLLASDRNAGSVHYLMLDVNGDGLPDAVEVSNLTARVRVAIATGQDYLPPVLVPILGELGGNSNATTTSIDGNQDGRVDIFDLYPGCDPNPNGPVTFEARPGLTFASIPYSGSPVGPVVGCSYLTPKVLDANGDGLSDFVRTESPTAHDNSPEIVFYLRRGKKANLLRQVADGTGQTVDIDYKPTTDPSVHTPTSCSYPQSCTPKGTAWVVSKHSVEQPPDSFNPPSTPLRSTTHQYKGLRIDLTGFGYLGMDEHKQTDDQTGQVSITTYSNQYSSPSTTGTKLYTHLGRPITRTIKTTLSPSGEVNTQNWGYTDSVVVKDAGARVVITPGITSYSEVVSQPPGSNAPAGTKRSWQITTTHNDTYGYIKTRSRLVGTTGEFEERTFTYDPDRPSDWLVGLLHREVTEYTTPARPETGAPVETTTRTIEYGHDSNTGVIDRVTIEPDSLDETIYLEKTYQRNGRGQINLTRMRNLNGIERVATVDEFDPVSQVYPQRVTNALQQTSFIFYHSGLGVPIRTLDPNAHEARTKYDRFGRVREQTMADGFRMTRDYQAAFDEDMVAGMRIHTNVQGRETSDTYDVNGNLVSTETKDEAGAQVRQEMTYDPYGRLLWQTRPFPAASRPFPMPQVGFTYDELGRMTSATAAPGVKSWRYEVNTTIRTVETDTGSQEDEWQEDQLNRLVKRVERVGATATVPAHDVTTRYGYGPFGVFRDIFDTYGNHTHVDYDVLGRRTALQDPDTGPSTESYNAFGELTSRTDADGRTVNLQSDALGRPVLERMAVGDNVYVWDTAADGIGQMARVASSDGVVVEYDYKPADQFGAGHAAAERLSIDGSDLRIDYGYDDLARLKTIQYPSVAGNRYSVQYNYSPNSGELASIVDPQQTGGPPLFRVDSRNAARQILQETYGDGVVTSKTYDPVRGMLTSVGSTLTGASVQGIGYHYDRRGYLDSRTDVPADAGAATIQYFDHDELGRLGGWRGGPLSAAPSTAWSVKYSYDDIGNMLSRQLTSATAQDLKTFTPGGSAGPHAVTSATSQGATESFQYDLSGRQFRAPGRTVTFTDFDLPKTVTKAGASWTFQYDGLHGRSAKTGPSGTTLYLGDLYERRATPSGVTHVMYVPGEHDVVAQVTQTDGGSIDIEYFHSDRLGSMDVTVASGVAEQMRFDPFGSRVAPGSLASSPAVASAPNLSVTLGFTGHEHDDDLGLINMNGRIYDPSLARFLTPDPFVVRPDSSQSLNRYSYAENSPLQFIDPTGFENEGPGGSQRGPTERPGSDPKKDPVDEILKKNFESMERWKAKPERRDTGKERAGPPTAAPIDDQTPGKRAERTGPDGDISPTTGPDRGGEPDWHDDPVGFMQFWDLPINRDDTETRKAKEAARQEKEAERQDADRYRRLEDDMTRRLFAQPITAGPVNYVRTVNGPVDLRPTLRRIKSGGRFPHRNDGSIFMNREGLLPRQPEGYYREFVHPTPGVNGPGSQRIIQGQGGDLYYTPDHYRTFIRLN